jgi:hypothetical protein
MVALVQMAAVTMAPDASWAVSVVGAENLVYVMRPAGIR